MDEYLSSSMPASTDQKSVDPLPRHVEKILCTSLTKMVMSKFEATVLEALVDVCGGKLEVQGIVVINMAYLDTPLIVKLDKVWTPGGHQSDHDNQSTSSMPSNTSPDQTIRELSETLRQYKQLVNSFNIQHPQMISSHNAKVTREHSLPYQPDGKSFTSQQYYPQYTQQDNGDEFRHSISSPSGNNSDLTKQLSVDTVAENLGAIQQSSNSNFTIHPQKEPVSTKEGDDINNKNTPGKTAVCSQLATSYLQWKNDSNENIDMLTSYTLSGKEHLSESETSDHDKASPHSKDSCSSTGSVDHPFTVSADKEPTELPEEIGLSSAVTAKIRPGSDHSGEALSFSDSSDNESPDNLDNIAKTVSHEKAVKVSLSNDGVADVEMKPVSSSDTLMTDANMNVSTDSLTESCNLSCARCRPYTNFTISDAQLKLIEDSYTAKIHNKKISRSKKKALWHAAKAKASEKSPPLKVGSDISSHKKGEFRKKKRKSGVTDVLSMPKKIKRDNSNSKKSAKKGESETESKIITKVDAQISISPTMIREKSESKDISSTMSDGESQPEGSKEIVNPIQEGTVVLSDVLLDDVEEALEIPDYFSDDEFNSNRNSEESNNSDSGEESISEGNSEPRSDSSDRNYTHNPDKRIRRDRNLSARGGRQSRYRYSSNSVDPKLMPISQDNYDVAKNLSERRRKRRSDRKDERSFVDRRNSQNDSRTVRKRHRSSRSRSPSPEETRTIRLVPRTPSFDGNYEKTIERSKEENQVYHENYSLLDALDIQNLPQYIEKKRSLSPAMKRRLSLSPVSFTLSSSEEYQGKPRRQLKNPSALLPPAARAALGFSLFDGVTENDTCVIASEAFSVRERKNYSSSQIIVCDLCGEEFPCYMDMIYHSKRNCTVTTALNDPSSIRIFVPPNCICEWCYRGFSSIETLQNHKRNDCRWSLAGEKRPPLTCIGCGWSVSSVDHFSNHIRINVMCRLKYTDCLQSMTKKLEINLLNTQAELTKLNEKIAS